MNWRNLAVDGPPVDGPGGGAGINGSDCSSLPVFIFIGDDDKGVSPDARGVVRKGLVFEYALALAIDK